MGIFAPNLIGTPKKWHDGVNQEERIIQRDHMTASETRILHLPLISSTAPLAVVSMPKTAWYWLDDLVSRDYPGGYKALVKDFQKAALTPETLADELRQRAEAHCHTKMGTLYNLANDNARQAGIPLKTSASHPDTPDHSGRMPALYQLFRFLPHPTYLTTVWERRNYHLRDFPL